LTVESGGEVSGIGTISGAVVNNGLIYVPSQPLYLSPTANPLVIAGNVTGSGTMQLGPAQTKTFNNVTTTYGAILELQGAASNTVTYSDNLGMLELGQPSTFTGTIAPGPYSDAVDLAGVSLSSIASYSYAGNSSSGVLTLDRTDGTALTLRYAGDYTTADFKLSAGPQALSNSPPSLLVRNASVQTGNAFYVDGSQGVQRFIGTGFPNFIDTSGAAGSGDVAVDLVAGTVTKGGQLDATFTNIQGVQLGADTSAILGLASGTDLLYGGSGTDTFNGNGATDYIQGGTGTNLIFGSTGNEIFYSNGGADVMRGGSAANFMSGGSTPSSTDVFYGTTGNDYVYGHGGTVDLVGGNGNEFLSGGSGSNELDDRQQQGQVGLSELVGSTGTDLFYGGVGTNLMYGGSGTDTFVGSSGTDFVYGGAGRSFTYSGSGTDVVTTGAGNDYVQAGSGSLYFNDTAANLHAGRFDQLDGFSGSRSTDLYLPTAVQGSTSFVSQNGGTAITTAIGGGIAEVFVSNSAVAQVQAHTHFTL
jgi:Ca2+-binding RTX toxin-like protein